MGNLLKNVYADPRALNQDVFRQGPEFSKNATASDLEEC